MQRGFIAVALCLFVAGARAQTAFDDLVAAERAFAARSPEIGIKAAFLEAMAEHALLFRPLPVNGPAWFAQQPTSALTLRWCPAQALIAADGAFGVSEGPWTLTPADANAAPRHGRYLSVWERNAAGRFQLVADHGVDGAAAPCPAAVQALTGGEPLAAKAGSQARNDRLQALLQADHVRNQAPNDGVVGVQVMRQPEPAVANAGSLQLHSARMAQSGDLAVTLGGVATPSAQAYQRIWVYQDGAWRLRFELLR